MAIRKAMGAIAGAGLGGVLGRLVNRTMRARRPVPGRPKRAGTAGLELGARLLQCSRPLARFDTWLVGFHPLQEAPHVQMEAHHFCRIVNEDFIQCVVFDGNDRDALLTGVEFIVSEHLFETLPEEEKRYWHPHNYEILSGQLVAPGIPGPLEDRLMRRLVNSYGKTWHFWMSSQGDPLPMGECSLAWSFNRDGQADEQLIQARNRRYRVDPRAKRIRRAKLARYARPQRGVDALDSAFDDQGERPPGVTDAGERSYP